MTHRKGEVNKMNMKNKKKCIQNHRRYKTKREKEKQERKKEKENKSNREKLKRGK